MYPDYEKVEVNLEDEIDDKGILIIWGGADIHPSLYDRPNYASHVGEIIGHRDRIEVGLMARAIELGLPIIGVCRGAQLACAAAGGILIQDVSGHAGQPHYIETKDGKKLMTSSLHHQMMYPWSVSHELLAWSSPSRSKRYVGITEEEGEKIPKLNDLPIEPEIVWFPGIKCLAIQGHPEFLHKDHEFNVYVKELCGNYFK